MQQRLLQKTFDIKQRFANDSRAFCSFNSQNLYKMQEEREGRTFLYDDINSPGKQVVFEKDPMDNCPIKLIYESDSEVSECKIKTDAELIQEYKEWEEVNRSETSSQWAKRVRTPPEVIA